MKNKKETTHRFALGEKCPTCRYKQKYPNVERHKSGCTYIQPATDDVDLYASPQVSHTPTPWEVVRQGNQGDYVIVGDYTKIVRPAVKGGTIADIQRDLDNAEFIVEAVNAYEKLKTDNAKLQETISELQIQNSKGLYTPLHETERRKLKADNAALLDALREQQARIQAVFKQADFLNPDVRILLADGLSLVTQAITQAESEVRP